MMSEFMILPDGELPPFDEKNPLRKWSLKYFDCGDAPDMLRGLTNHLIYMGKINDRPVLITSQLT